MANEKEALDQSPLPPHWISIHLEEMLEYLITTI